MGRTNGPAPKEPSARARRNAPPTSERVIHVVRQAKPELADLIGEANPLTGEPWSAATTRLWVESVKSPVTDDWTQVQWHLWARTMMLDDRFMTGHAGSETALRQWMSQFPKFPTDMLRHRLTTVMVEEAETAAEKKRPAKKAAAKKKADDPRLALVQ